MVVETRETACRKNAAWALGEIMLRRREQAKEHALPQIKHTPTLGQLARNLQLATLSAVVL